MRLKTMAIEYLAISEPRWVDLWKTSTCLPFAARNSATQGVS